MRKQTNIWKELKSWQLMLCHGKAFPNTTTYIVSYKTDHVLSDSVCLD